MSTQLCPVCRQAQPISERYPHRVCERCVEEACDSANQPVHFYNTELGAGCVGVYTETRKPYPAHVCYVRGLPCTASEGQFGGIVLEPLDASSTASSQPLAAADAAVLAAAVTSGGPTDRSARRRASKRSPVSIADRTTLAPAGQSKLLAVILAALSFGMAVLAVFYLVT